MLVLCHIRTSLHPTPQIKMQSQLKIQLHFHIHIQNVNPHPDSNQKQDWIPAGSQSQLDFNVHQHLGVAVIWIRCLANISFGISIQLDIRAAMGNEPGTFRTLSENHTTRPSSQLFLCFETSCLLQSRHHKTMKPISKLKSKPKSRSKPSYDLFDQGQTIHMVCMTVMLCYIMLVEQHTPTNIATQIQF